MSFQPTNNKVLDYYIQTFWHPLLPDWVVDGAYVRLDFSINPGVTYGSNSQCSLY